MWIGAIGVKPMVVLSFYIKHVRTTQWPIKNNNDCKKILIVVTKLVGNMLHSKFQVPYCQDNLSILFSPSKMSHLFDVSIRKKRKILQEKL